MSARLLNQLRRWGEAVRRVAALEYSLIDACHAASENAWDVERARLAARAGAAQVHLFDLGTALRELGDDSLSYSRCVRLAMLQGGRPEEVVRRLEREYARLMLQRELPERLRALLRANLAEHLGLDHVGHDAALAC